MLYAPIVRHVDDNYPQDLPLVVTIDQFSRDKITLLPLYSVFGRTQFLSIVDIGEIPRASLELSNRQDQQGHITTSETADLAGKSDRGISQNAA